MTGAVACPAPTKLWVNLSPPSATSEICKLQKSQGLMPEDEYKSYTISYIMSSHSFAYINSIILIHSLFLVITIWNNFNIFSQTDDNDGYKNGCVFYNNRFWYGHIWKELWNFRYTVLLCEYNVMLILCICWTNHQYNIIFIWPILFILLTS